VDSNTPSQPAQPITPETQTSVTQPIPQSLNILSNKIKYILLGLLFLLILAAVGGGTYYLAVVKQPTLQKNKVRLVVLQKSKSDINLHTVIDAEDKRLPELYGYIIKNYRKVLETPNYIVLKM
jgi:hypothetical protein